jgi:hypothetical protein
MTTLDLFQSMPATAVPSTRPPSDAHILAILPRGEAIRNFVYSGALDVMARSAEVSVLTVSPSPEIWRDLASRYERIFELTDEPEPRSVGALRDLLDMAHGRWLWSKAAELRWELRDAEAVGAGARAKRLAKKLACLPFSNAVGLELLSRVESGLSRRHARANVYVDLLRRLAPTLVFNGSHVHSRVATPAVYAAKALGIPTAAFVFSWDNLTSQGRMIPRYDYYLVWSTRIADELVRMYPSVRRDRVLVTGTPQFDFHFRPEYHWDREAFAAKVGADPARPIVLYSTGMPNHMPGEPAVVEGVADALARMTDLGPPQLLVRVYAKDRTRRFDALRARRPDILFSPVAWEEAWHTPTLEDSFMLTNSLRHAAVGVNIASTISLELFMFDKPVVNVAYEALASGTEPSVALARYYEFEHYRPLVQRGAVVVARSEDELAVAVRQALADPQVGATSRRNLLLDMFGHSLDGYSAVRVAEQLASVAAVGRQRRAGAGRRASAAEHKVLR